MISTNEIPQFKQISFDNNKYVNLQQTEILKRINELKDGHLYMEIGGKLFFDAHAARVLPGFDPKVKVNILKSLNIPFDILFCMNYNDILNNRQLNSYRENYVDSSLKIINELQNTFEVIPKICINNVKLDKESTEFIEAIKKIYSYNPNIYFRYYIPNYPSDIKTILSLNGFGRDSDIPIDNKLVIVNGSASNSGKLSTCLGMIYKDSIKELHSNYTKYETFPIWNLPLKHPVNLAYEAATADIGDKNVLDTYYMASYKKQAVNYNRDVDAFKIVKALMKSEYNSPTDMGISNAGMAITNDEVVCIASLHEIRRRKEWYKEIDNNLSNVWVKTCEELENDALTYIIDHGYNPNLEVE